jgi:hypothetical protein
MGAICKFGANRHLLACFVENTWLQPGARKMREEKNRLNGFYLLIRVHRVKTRC